MTPPTSIEETPVTAPADVLDIAQPWLAVCGPCDAGLPQACTHPSGDYRVVMKALAEEVRRARAEAAVYAAAGRAAAAADIRRATRAYPPASLIADVARQCANLADHGTVNDREPA